MHILQWGTDFSVPLCLLLLLLMIMLLMLPLLMLPLLLLLPVILADPLADPITATLAADAITNPLATVVASHALAALLPMLLPHALAPCSCYCCMLLLPILGVSATLDSATRAAESPRQSRTGLVTIFEISSCAHLNIYC